MATAARYEDRQVAIGRVFARAFATIAANPLAVFGIAFLFGAVPGVLVTIATQALGASGLSLGWTPVGLVAGVVAMMASVTFSLMAQGALVRVAAAHAEGDRVHVGAALLTGLRAAAPLFVLGLLMTIAIAFGLVFLFVPGVILYVMWSVAAPALVEERCGVFGALARSRALTKGARWRVFALEAVVLIFYWLIAAVVGVGAIVFAHLLSNGVATPIWAAALGAVSTTLTTGVWGTIQTSLYIELRDWKDGPATGRLAEIFG